MRKKRHILSQNWKSIRENIEEVIKEYQIAPEDFKSVNINDWEAIENKIVETFCDFPLSYKYRPTWLSTYFKQETTGLSNLVEQSYKYIDELIAPDERVWFFVNDSKDKFWFYEGNYKSVKTIIEESFWNEFYIASKKYEWLLNMTHHDIVLATGTDMSQKLKAIKERVDPILKKKHE